MSDSATQSPVAVLAASLANVATFLEELADRAQKQPPIPPGWAGDALAQIELLRDTLEQVRGATERCRHALRTIKDQGMT
jgi:hypothetical protein